MVKFLRPGLLSCWLTILSMLCLPVSTLAKESTGLQLSISSKQVELGKPFRITLSSVQTKVSLNDIDLASLLPDFHISDTSDPEIKNNTQQKKLLIYPRRTGWLSIPGLNFINSTTKAIAVEVTPPIDPKNDTIIDIQSSVSTFKPWKKQEVIVKLEFITRAKIIIFNTPNAYSSHSKIIPLETLSEPVMYNKQTLTRHVTGWVIYPEQPGSHQLTLPAINLVRDGITTHHFYPPLINLEVKNLPVYIPSSMPVGKLDFDIIKKPTSALFTNNLGQLQFRLSGYGNTPASLPALNSQLKSTEAISIYPPEITEKRHGTKNGVRSEAIYDINFKINQQGIHPFGNINLPYFDPENGTINSLTKNIGTIFSVHPWVVFIASILVSAFLIRAMMKSWQWITNKWQTYRHYQTALGQIRKACNPQNMKNCLNLIAKAEDWPANLTIRQWYSHSQAIQGDVSIQELTRLEQTLYRNEEQDMERLKADLIKLCYQRHNSLKWLLADH